MEKTAASLKVGDQVHCLSEQVATLGRASDNTIVLNDDSVSSHHAEIFMRDGVYFVRDLGSTNNTTLRGVSVSESELNSDDILSFGTVEAVFQSVSQIQESSNSEDQDSSDQPNDSQAPNHLSLGDKLRQFGKAAWAETKRSSHLISLKAQIEKLTRIDLRQAFHDLGKTCYESKIGEEKFSSHFKAICSLQERIAEGRKGVHAAEGAKSVEKLKAAAQDQAGKITSEALSVKRGSLFVDLGKAGESQTRDLMPKEHLDVIDRIQKQISSLQADVANTSTRSSPSASIFSTYTFQHWRLLGGLVIGAFCVLGLGKLVMKSSSVVSHTSDEPKSALFSIPKGAHASEPGANTRALNPGTFLKSLTLKTESGKTTIPSVLLISSGPNGGDQILQMDIALSGRSEAEISQQMLRGITLQSTIDSSPAFFFDRGVVDSFEMLSPSGDLSIASKLIVQWAMSQYGEAIGEKQKAFFDDEIFLEMLSLKEIGKDTVNLQGATKEFCANTRNLLGRYIAEEFVVLGRLGPNTYEAKRRYDLGKDERFVLKTKGTTFESSGIAWLAVENCGMTVAKTTDGFEKKVRLLEEREICPPEIFDKLIKDQSRLNIQLLSLLRDSNVDLGEVGRTIKELKLLCDVTSPRIGNYNTTGMAFYVDNPPALNYSSTALLYCILAITRHQ